MANELKIKNGLLVVGNEQITGSLTVSQGITSSLGLFGTASNAVLSFQATSASFASTVITASFATNAGTAATASYITASNVVGFIITSSFSINSGLAATASFASTVVTASFATQAGTTATASFASSVVTASYASSFTRELTTGSLYPITSSWAGTASVLLGSISTASFAAQSYTASNLSNFTFDNSSSVSLVTASNNIVLQRLTGSFLSANYQYVLYSGSNLRVGSVFGGWLPSGSQVTFAEYVTTDIGDTSQVSMSIFLTQSAVQLLSNAATSYSWSLRTLATYL